MAFVHSPQIVTSGLVLSLDAGNTKSYTSGSTTWFDKSGFSNNGTLINGPTFNTGSLGSIVFDGVDDYVTCGSSSILDVGNNITVNSWFYINSITSYQAIIAKHFSDGSAGWEMSNSTGGSLRVTLRPSATQINLSGGTLSVGNWYMGTYTFDNTTLILYLNGIQVGSTTTGGPVTLNTSRPLQIGVREIQGLGYFNGNIAISQLYNRALSAQEVLQNFNALRGRYGI
jgi:hypothetical protein